MSNFPDENDFGFSAVDDIPNEEVKVESTIDTSTIEDKLDIILNRMDNLESSMESRGDIVADDYWKAKLVEIETLIVPMLEGLAQNSDKVYIKWPNRKPLLEEKIRQIRKLTR